MTKSELINRVLNKREIFYELYYLIEIKKQRIKNLLTDTSRTISENENEKYKYCLIKMVTCLELCFRNYMCNLIDFGAPYKDNIHNLKDLKHNNEFKIVDFINTKQITLGLYISNAVKMSSIENIFSNMDIILGNKFKTLLKQVKYKEIEDNDGLIIEDPEHICSDIANIFIYRNKVVHEFVYSSDMNIIKTNIYNWFKSFSLFIEASDHIINELINPQYYMTQAELNEYTTKQYQTLKNEMSDYINEIIEMDSNIGQKIQFLQNSWEKYAMESANVMADEYKTGTVYPYMININLIMIAKKRVEYLSEIANLVKYDNI